MSYFPLPFWFWGKKTQLKPCYMVYYEMLYHLEFCCVSCWFESLYVRNCYQRIQLWITSYLYYKPVSRSPIFAKFWIILFYIWYRLLDVSVFCFCCSSYSQSVSYVSSFLIIEKSSEADDTWFKTRWIIDLFLYPSQTKIPFFFIYVGVWTREYV